MNKLGKKFLKATNGGLEIIQKYLSTPFELNEIVESEVNSKRSFKVFWSERYNNYVIKIYSHGVEKERLNAIWFVKWLFEIQESKVYEKLDTEMKLSILNPVVEASKDEIDQSLEVSSHKEKALAELAKLQ